jgi:hypothetical protein
MRTTFRVFSLAALAAVGCGGGADGRPGGMAGMHTDSGAMGGMPMGGGMMGGKRMMPAMRAHMDSMMRLPPGGMSRMMRTHERMSSEMLDGMAGEMRAMKMSGSPAWDSLTDSVKRDLAELPSLTGQELSRRMKAHGGRVRRLMEMHEGMMGGEPDR